MFFTTVILAAYRHPGEGRDPDFKGRGERRLDPGLRRGDGGGRDERIGGAS